jgi:hypothetical protein
MLPDFIYSLPVYPQEGTEPYMVVQNRSLIEMVRMRPANHAELISVWGMGPVRVRARN